MTHISIPSTRPICPGPQRPLWNICLDNLPHYILRGLLRPRCHQLPTLHHHRHSHRSQLPHIRCQLNTWSLLHLQQQAPIRRHSILSHRHLPLLRHQHSQQHGQLLLFQLMNPLYHLHYYRVHITHLESINLHLLRPLHRHLPQLLLDIQQ